jgi:hypothetical protein
MPIRTCVCPSMREGARLRLRVRVLVRVRVCVCVFRRTHARTHASAPKLAASTFRRRGSFVARLAGVPLDVGLQREHRRVEHCRSVKHVRGMHRFRLAARTAADALGRCSMCDSRTCASLRIHGYV